MADRDQQGRKKGPQEDDIQMDLSRVMEMSGAENPYARESRARTGAAPYGADNPYGEDAPYGKDNPYDKDARRGQDLQHDRHGHPDQGKKTRPEDSSMEDLEALSYQGKRRWNGVMALILVLLGIILIGTGVYIAFFYKNPNKIDPAPGKMLKAESSQEAPVPVEDVVLKLEDLDGEHFLRVENKNAKYAIKEVTLTYEVPTKQSSQAKESGQEDRSDDKDADGGEEAASQAAKAGIQTQVGPQYRLLQIPCPIAPQGSSGLLWIADPEVLQNIAFLQYAVRQGEKQYLITYNSAYGTYTLADQSKEKHLGESPLVSMDELKVVIQVKDHGREVMVKNGSQAEISGLQVTYEGPNRILGYFNIFSDRIAGGETKTYDDIDLPEGDVQVISVVYIANNQTVITYDAVNDQYEFSTMKDVPTA